jgi:dihydroorotase
MNPPLRHPADRDALLEGLKDGTVDVIATDHAPHHEDDKKVEFDRASFGIVGLETSVGLSLKLVHDGALTITQLIERMSAAPGRIIKNGGTLSIGAPADITIIDPDVEWTVDASQFLSRSRNTPFGGWKLKGRAVRTIVGGKL